MVRWRPAARKAPSRPALTRRKAGGRKNSEVSRQRAGCGRNGAKTVPAGTTRRRRIAIPSLCPPPLCPDAALAMRQCVSCAEPAQRCSRQTLKGGSRSARTSAAQARSGDAAAVSPRNVSAIAAAQRSLPAALTCAALCVCVYVYVCIVCVRVCVCVCEVKARDTTGSASFLSSLFSLLFFCLLFLLFPSSPSSPRSFLHTHTHSCFVAVAQQQKERELSLSFFAFRRTSIACLPLSLLSPYQ